MKYRSYTHSVFFCASILTLVACRSKTSREIVESAAFRLDSVGHESFNGYHISAIRGGKKSSYQVSKLDGTGDYAIFRMYPEMEIEKNFRDSTFTMRTVVEFKNLGCRYLIYDNNFVRADWAIRDSVYILYKGRPERRPANLPSDTSSFIHIDEKWRYKSF